MAVQPTEATFEELLNAVPDAMLVTSGDGRVLLANRQAERLFGYKRAELLGRPVEQLMPERYRTQHVGHRQGYLEAPRVRPMGAGLELAALAKDGREIPVEISLSPSSLDGELVVISTIRDVSARKRLEAEREQAHRQLQAVQFVTDTALSSLAIDDLLSDLLQRLRAVVEVDTSAILLLDEAGEQLIPRAASGYEQEEGAMRIPVGAGFAGRVAVEREAVAIEDVDPGQFVNPALRSAGVRALLGVPLLVGERLLGVLHVGSLTPRRFSAEDGRLLQLVADRAALAIDRARLYAEAREAVQLRNEFLSAISHDLGNPVAAIRLESRLLKEAVTEGSRRDELLEGLGQIESAATRMWKQVAELLDLARLQVGRALELNWKPLDLLKLLEETIQAQQATTSAHRILLATDVPGLQGEWDATRLERVFTNLLSNAIKYSPGGGEISVRVHQQDGDAADSSTAVIEIQDSGIGIPAADLPHIFERFHRASNARGQFAGTGIGLAGAQQIVNLHGGEIIVESEEGQGTTVTLRLPLEATPAGED